MAIETVRGCGYRMVGGIYLVANKTGPLNCDRLPFPIPICPTCGGGIHFTRGFQFVDGLKLLGDHPSCKEAQRTVDPCPVCHPSKYQIDLPDGKASYAIIWVGERFYSPAEFIIEALNLGVSRRVQAMPRRIKIGHTWILFAHKKAIADKDPGIFYAFRPQRIEKLLWARDATKEVLDNLIKSGITPVIIPDGDTDHDPEAKDVEDAETPSFDSLRRMFQHSDEEDEGQETVDDPDGDLPAGEDDDDV